jgi:hypothetical protein
MDPEQLKDGQIEKSILVDHWVLRCGGGLLNFCTPANPTH